MAELAGWSFNGLAALRLLLGGSGRSRRGDRRKGGVECSEHIRGHIDALAGGESRTDLEEHVGSAPLHHLTVDRAQLIADLLLNVGLVAADLLLTVLHLLLSLLELGLVSSRAGLQRG